MSQITTGIYRLVTIPWIYRIIQSALGGPSTRKRLVEELISIQPGQRVLDLGCGSAEVLHYLPECDYVGVDSNPSHIEEARRVHGTRGRFVVGDAAALASLGRFDLVLGLGLLHHLGDRSAKEVLGQAAGLLDETGRVFMLDPCYAKGQHAIAKFLIDRDSGRAVRSEPGYRRLGENAFELVETRVIHDLLRVPYTHCVMECRRPRTACDAGS